MNICTNLILTQLVQIDANKASTYWIFIYSYEYWLSIEIELVYNALLIRGRYSKQEHMYKPITFSSGSYWCQQGEYLLNIYLSCYIFNINWKWINISKILFNKINWNMSICTNGILTCYFQIDANKVSTYWICTYPVTYWI